ncbi:YHS domain-containing protein [bacterium]|nr:YHS domain-containing protein [bacterium]
MPDENLPVIKTVCGGILENPENYPTAKYKEEIVYFCTEGCLRAFKKDPDLFIAGEIEHPLD